MVHILMLLIKIITFKGPASGLRMPLERKKTGCPGCGRSIEIRENDPQFFEARFRAGGRAIDTPKIPGRCGVCGGPLPRKKRDRNREWDSGSDTTPDDKPRAPRMQPDRGSQPFGEANFLGLGLHVWILLAAGSLALVMFLLLVVVVVLSLGGR
jgi:hypothetical protein